MATNRDSYNVYGDASKADIILESVGINPDLSDKLQLSLAYGMIDGAGYTSQKVGDTQESRNNSALLGQARYIFEQEGVEFPVKYSIPTINAVKWV